MKKLTLLAALAGTDVLPYNGQTMTVTTQRYVLTGWNTLCLPFDLTEEQLNDAFGNDCRLEQLVAVDADQSTLTLNFADCKAGGVKAGTPYILHYTGETGNKTITVDATVSSTAAPQTHLTANGITVTMDGATRKTDAAGKYGILAVDNAEATFVHLDRDNIVFLATRCFIETSSAEPLTLVTRHLKAGELASINDIAASAAGQCLDVYNLQGMRVAANASADQLRSLNPGIYIIGGQKVLVK